MDDSWYERIENRTRLLLANPRTSGQLREQAQSTLIVLGWLAQVMRERDEALSLVNNALERERIALAGLTEPARLFFDAAEAAELLSALDARLDRLTETQKSMKSDRPETGITMAERGVVQSQTLTASIRERVIAAMRLASRSSG